MGKEHAVPAAGFEREPQRVQIHCPVLGKGGVTDPHACKDISLLAVPLDHLVAAVHALVLVIGKPLVERAGPFLLDDRHVEAADRLARDDFDVLGGRRRHLVSAIRVLVRFGLDATPRHQSRLHVPVQFCKELGVFLTCLGHRRQGHDPAELVGAALDADLENQVLRRLAGLSPLWKMMIASCERSLSEPL